MHWTAIFTQIYSNFTYYPIAWHLSSAKLKNKIENIQQRVLKLLHNNSEQTSIFKPGLSTMEVKRLRILAIEVYKKINIINPSYMKEIFLTSNNRSSERFKYNITSQRFNQVKYGETSITST